MRDYFERNQVSDQSRVAARWSHETIYSAIERLKSIQTRLTMELSCM
jgi:hypothetical protein